MEHKIDWSKWRGSVNNSRLQKILRIKAEHAELVEALGHCVNAIKEYERDPSEDIRPFLLGALDKATAILEKVK